MCTQREPLSQASARVSGVPRRCEADKAEFPGPVCLTCMFASLWDSSWGKYARTCSSSHTLNETLLTAPICTCNWEKKTQQTTILSRSTAPPSHGASCYPKATNVLFIDHPNGLQMMKVLNSNTRYTRKKKSFFFYYNYYWFARYSTGRRTLQSV